MAYRLSTLRSIFNILNRNNNRITSNHYINNVSKRCVSSYLLAKLNDRKVLSLSGNDSYSYLQGLVTNDMKHLSPEFGDTSLDIIYAFLLTVGGRVMADLCIYKSHNTIENELYLDVDSSLSLSIFNFLKKYRVRRKVNQLMDNKRDVYALFPANVQNIEEINDFESIVNEDIIIVKDPRINELGFRIVFKSNLYNYNACLEKVRKLLTAKQIEVNEGSVEDYRRHRYQLGVPEGNSDMPTEGCFPLEYNADYLHGVSFQKGCYVGQELTARIYHTGVIRKRVMPIEIECDDQKVLNSFDKQTNLFIYNEDGKNVGKYRNNCGSFGIALLRIDDALKAKQLKLFQTGLTLKTYKPEWWPKESSKSVIPCGRH